MVVMRAIWLNILFIGLNVFVFGNLGCYSTNWDIPVTQPFPEG